MSEPHLVPFEPESWLESFAKVVKYKEEHGNCIVPRRWRRDPALGEWVRFQRRQFRKRQLNRRNHNMTDDRIRKLEAIGFEWSRSMLPGTVVAMLEKSRLDAIMDCEPPSLDLHFA
mmetsp:Transcript_16114/g.23583  ORF Transcript_16114/g.23583 Transcript_16114/m.23583 type:complete len:116 (-) Transcript_16114:48-395(-)